MKKLKNFCIVILTVALVTGCFFFPGLAMEYSQMESDKISLSQEEISIYSDRSTSYMRRLCIAAEEQGKWGDYGQEDVAYNNIGSEEQTDISKERMDVVMNQLETLEMMGIITAEFITWVEAASQWKLILIPIYDKENQSTWLIEKWVIIHYNGYGDGDVEQAGSAYIYMDVESKKIFSLQAEGAPGKLMFLRGDTEWTERDIQILTNYGEYLELGEAGKLVASDGGGQWRDHVAWLRDFAIPGMDNCAINLLMAKDYDGESLTWHAYIFPYGWTEYGEQKESFSQ